MATTTVFRANESLASGENDGIARGVASTVGPASYVQGGFAIDLATDESLGNDPYSVICEQVGDASGTPKETANVLDYVALYDYANKKLIVYDPADGSEAAGTTDLSGHTFRLKWEASKA